jgi:uncharacterized damage-inducible protein DinB
MRIERVGTLRAVLAVVIACVPASLQAQPAVISSLLRDIDQLEQKLIGLAEAMPPAAMEWRPAEGVRSMNEVLMHVAADNYFLPTAAGVDAPAGTGIRANDYPTVQAYETRRATKDEAIAAVRASFEHLRAAMRRADDASLARRLSVFGMEMTGMDLWVLTTTHLHEHLGQGIAYARSNNVVPPWSRQQ